MRNTLIKAGVKNLKTFGFSEVNEQNILTDLVYKAFFKGMLKRTLETAIWLKDLKTQDVCKGLLKEVEGQL